MSQNKRINCIAALGALPFVALATLAWIGGVSSSGANSVEAYFLGDVIYLVGSPLTLVVLRFHNLTGHVLTAGDDIWAIPLIDVLFIVQWIFWGQLILRIVRLFTGIRAKML
jgi:hypothetical protein